jgi:hypothetical protein
VNSDVSAQLDSIQIKLDQLLAGSAMANQRFLGVNEAATYAGLSPASVRRLIAANRLTPLRPVRGKIVIDRRELENVILGSTTVPRSGRGRRERK